MSVRDNLYSRTQVLRTSLLSSALFKLLGGTSAKRKILWIPGACLLIAVPALALTNDSSRQDASNTSFNITADSVSNQSNVSESQNEAPETDSTASVQVKTESSSNSDVNVSESVNVSVNGQDVPIPSNGVVNKTITSNSSQTHLSISVKSDNSSSSKNSTDLQINNKQVNNETQANLRDGRWSSNR